MSTQTAPTSGSGLRPAPLAIAMASTTIASLPVFLVGGLAALVRQELGFSRSQLGLLVALFWVAATLLSPLGGALVERLDAGRSIALSALGAAVVLFGIGLVAQSWLHLVVFMCLGGVVTAFAQPASNLMITEAIPPHRNGIAFGIKQSSVPLATLLAGSAVPVIGVTWGWRPAFVMAGILALLTMLAAFRRSTVRDDRPPTKRPRPLRPLLGLAVVAAFGAAAGNAMGAFFVDSAVADGFDVGLAGALLAFGGLVSMLLRILLGWRADFRQGDDIGVIMALLLIGAVGFAVIPLASTALLLVLATAVAFGGGWTFNGLLLRTVVVDYPAAPAAATGVTQTGVYAGAVFGPLTFGVIADNASYGVAWWVTAVWLLLGAGVAAWLRFEARGLAAEGGVA